MSRVDPEPMGRRIADALGEGPSTRRRLAQRERLIRAAATRPRRARSPAWIVATAAALVAIVGVAFVLLQRGPVDAPEIVVVATEGAWIEAPPAGAIEVAVDDGTSVRLVESARGRIATPSAQQGRVSLEAGRVEAEVRPDAGRRWTVEAGPYRVVVVGTVFAVDWDPSTNRFEVEVLRGKVEVSGGSIGAQPIVVDTGHRLRANHLERTMSLAPRERGEPEPAPEDAAPEASPDPDNGADRHARRRSIPEREERPTWRSEADAGNYRAALELAKAEGFDKLLRTLGSDDLLRLADTTRLAKERALAKRAYETVRARFGGTTAASRAAFQLGRLTADGEGKHGRAAQWFETYLRESPRGTYAREAQGRLVQSLSSAGDAARARKAAREYLERYPTGPHARLARSLTEATP